LKDLNISLGEWSFSLFHVEYLKLGTQWGNMDGILAVDIGGTETSFAVGGEEGIEEVRNVKTSEIKSIDDLIDELQDFVDVTGVDPVCISVVSAGVVDQAEMEVLEAAHIEEMSLDILGEKFGCEVLLENDANAGALAEQFFNYKSRDNLVYLVMGSGIGAGVILGNELLRSAKDGGVAEVGFSVINYSGEQEHFSRKGVWEAYSSGANISDQFKDFSGKPDVSPSEIFSMAEEEGGPASKFIEKIGRINAAGFATVINNFNPEVIVVGGSMPRKNPDFFEAMKNNLQESIDEFVVNPMPDIELTEFESPELRGAIANAIKNSDQA
jgi:glucokinase